MSAAPTHIKRPLNAFMVFSQQERAKLSGLYRNNSETSQEIGKRWRELSDEDKAPFYQTAKLLKEQHEKVSGNCKNAKILSKFLQKYPGYKYQPKQKKGKGKDEPSVSARRSAPYTIPPGASSEKPVKIAEDKDEDVYTPSGDQLVADEKQNSDAVSGEGVATTSQAIAAVSIDFFGWKFFKSKKCFELIKFGQKRPKFRIFRLKIFF